MLFLSLIQSMFLTMKHLQTGFVTGIAVLILAEQLPSLLGIPISVAGDFATYEKLRLSFTNLYRIHLPTLAVGLSSLTLLYALAYIFKVLGAQGRPWIHRIPVVVLVMFLSILVSALGNLSALGVPVLGVFEHALTTPSAPFLTTELMARLFIDVVMLTLTGFIQMQSVTRTFSIKNDYNVSGDRELFAIGTANVVGACFGGYTVFGSLPRSRIMDLSGSKTTLANLFSAVWVLIALYALHPVLRYIPKATLAAIIFKAATALIEFRDIRFILRIHAWTDLAMFLSTFLITFTSTISNGIIMCLLLATLIIIRKISAADLSIMGHMSPQEHRKAALTETASHGLYLDIKEHPDAQVSEGILILSIRGPLVFYNCGTLPRTIDVLTKTDMELLKRQRLVSLDKTETVMIPMTRANRSSSMIVMDDGAIKSRVFSLDENRLSNESLAASRRSLSRGLSMPRIRHTRSQSEPLAVHRTPSETLSTHFEPDLHPYVIIMDFARCTDLDSSAMLVLDQVIASYKHKKTAFLLTGLHPFHHRLFNKAGLVLKLGEENLFETLEEAIVAVKKRRV